MFIASYNQKGKYSLVPNLFLSPVTFPVEKWAKKDEKDIDYFIIFHNIVNMWWKNFLIIG